MTIRPNQATSSAPLRLLLFCQARAQPMLVLQLYRRLPDRPLWEFHAAALPSRDGSELLAEVARQLRKDGYKTRLVCMSVRDISAYLAEEKFRGHTWSGG